MVEQQANRHVASTALKPRREARKRERERLQTGSPVDLTTRLLNSSQSCQVSGDINYRCLVR